MADAPVIQQGTVAPVTAAGEGTTTPQFVELSKFEELQTNYQNLVRQVNGLSAVQRAAKKPVAPDPEPTEQQTVTLKSLKAELDTRDTRIRQKAINTEIRAFAKNNGISDDALPIFEAFVEKQYKTNLTTNDNDEVVYQDPLGDQKPFDVLGKMILAGSAGRTFLPPVETPGGVGQRTQFGGQSRSTALPDIGSMSVEQMIANPAAADAAMRQKAQMLSQGATIRT